MTQVFRAGSVHKVDSKGRVSVPASFRRVLEQRDPAWAAGAQPGYVLVYAVPRHIVVYTQEGIAEIDRKISSLQRGSERRERLEDIFYDMALPGSTDDAGRMLIPADLREKYGIGAEARFRGRGETFHIMRPEFHVAHTEKTKSWIDSEPEDFDPGYLLDVEDETLGSG